MTIMDAVQWGGVILAVVTTIGTAAAYGVYVIKKELGKLTQADEEAKRTLTENLLEQYKELYNLEKERAERDRADLQRRLDSVTNQLHQLQAELEQVKSQLAASREESDKLRELNLKYQSDKRSDSHTIANLQQAINAIKSQNAEQEEKINKALHRSE